MSTTAESAIEDGAKGVFGVAPFGSNLPARTDYKKVVKLAIDMAKSDNLKIILVTEPRIASDNERLKYVKHIKDEIEEHGVGIENIVANQGIETPKLANLSKKVVIIASQTGGSAFDAATAGGASKVLTGTIVRTMKATGLQNTIKAAKRAIEAAKSHQKGITVVAATANSLDDWHGAKQIAAEILREGFLLI